MKNTLLFSCILSVVLATGCQTSPAFRVESVEGVVTLDGEPVEGATLTFVPTDPAVGKSAYARTGAQGRYTLTAVEGGPSGGGTLAGTYGVAVSLDKPSREPTTREIEDRERGIEPDIPLVAVVPAKYNDTQTSGLTAEVVKGKNRFDFALTTSADPNSDRGRVR